MEIGAPISLLTIQFPKPSYPGALDQRRFRRSAGGRVFAYSGDPAVYHAQGEDGDDQAVIRCDGFLSCTERRASSYGHCARRALIPIFQCDRGP